MKCLCCSGECSTAVLHHRSPVEGVHLKTLIFEPLCSLVDKQAEQHCNR